MTKESFWKTVFKTPSAARTATVVMLVTWFVAAVWGWFFVEPTVLRDSQAAHDYVEWASKMFPWLDNIRRLVPQAEKGLYLHSVYTVALAPFSVITALVIVLRPEGKERENEEEESYQLLSDAYNDFLKVVLANSDLQLRSHTALADPTPEQRERMLVIFDMLIALFERAYLIAFKPKMTAVEARRWIRSHRPDECPDRRSRVGETCR